MSNEPFMPPLPHVDPPSQETIERLQNMTKKDHKQFKKSDAYKKYVLPTLERHKKQTRLKRQEWWWAKGLPILNLVLALIAAITGILALILR